MNRSIPVLTFSLALIFASLICQCQQPAGSIDRSFGRNGYSLFNIKDNQQSITMLDQIFLPDNSWIIANESGGKRYFLSKFKSNGSPDSSFLNNGIHTFITERDSADRKPVKLHYQPSSKKILLIRSGESPNPYNLLSIHRLQDNGKYDSTFGIHGKASLHNILKDSLFSFKFSSIDSRSRILLTGTRYISSDVNPLKLITYRLTADGQLDASYGSNGCNNFLETKENLTYTQVDLINNDTLLYCLNGYNYQIICKSLPEGKLFTGMGKNGIITLAGAFGSGFVRIFPSEEAGMIMRVGISSYGDDISVRRIKSNGNIDTSFNPKANGLYTYDWYPNSYPYIIVPLKEGGCLAAFKSELQMTFVKLRPDFKVDSSWGTNGRLPLTIQENTGFPIYSWEPGSFQILTSSEFSCNTYRYTFNNSGIQSDATFGIKGKMSSSYLASMDKPIGAATAADGKTWVLSMISDLGNIFYEGASQYLLRFLPDGNADLSFGNKGMMEFQRPFIPYLPGEGNYQALHVTKNNKLIIAYYYEKNLHFQQLNIDGTPDAAFGKNGILEFSMNGTITGVTKFVSQPDGKILVGLNMLNSNREYYSVIIRLTDNGRIDPQFEAFTSLFMLDDFIYTSTNRIIVLTSILTARKYLYALLPDGGLDKEIFIDGISIPDRGDLMIPKSLVEISRGLHYTMTMEDLYDSDTAKQIRIQTFTEKADAPYPFIRTTVPDEDYHGLKWNKSAFGSYLQNDKKMIVGAAIYSTTYSKVRLTRFMPSGKIDSAFGVNGHVIIDSLAPNIEWFNRGSPYNYFLRAPDNNLLLVTSFEDKKYADITIIKILLNDITCEQAIAAPVIEQNGYFLHSSASWGNQWYLNNQPITGATEQNYMPAVPGSYTVKITEQSCTSKASNAIQVVTTSINSPDLDNQIRTGPNPVNNLLTIQYKGNLTKFEISLWDLSGRRVSTVGYFTNTYQLDMTKYTPGNYFLKIINTKNGLQINRKIIKL